MLRQCKICDKSINAKAFGMHVKVHGLTFMQYVEKFLDDFENYGHCEVCGTLTSKSKKMTACSIECAGKIKSKLYTGRIPWNVGLTKETDERLAQLSKTRKAQGTIRFNYKHSIETRKNISKSLQGKRKGKNNPMYGKTHTPEAIKKIMKHRPCTSLELKMKELLDEHNIKYTFQFFINNNRVCKSYDFKIKNSNVIIEVDGDYWHGNPNTDNHHKFVNETKLNDLKKTKLAESRGYTVLRFWESDVLSDKNTIINQIKQAINSQ